MTTSPQIKTAVITGATGLIGRWLLTELTAAGVDVLALVRKAPQRQVELRAWADTHGGQGHRLTTANFDLDASDLGLDDASRRALQSADAVYHLAARFDFGLARDSAHRANVTAPLALIELLGSSTSLQRLVHISGYRTQGGPALALDVDNPAELTRFYAEHGAYETSKIEAHIRVQRAVEKHGVPLTIISPAMVIGDSRSGETTQMTGLADIVKQLWQRQLPALAGSRGTWLPVVAVDFLAKLLARTPGDADSLNQHIVVFDDRSPTLPDLLRLAATRMDVSAPSVILPTGLIRALPEALTGMDAESLSFISDDRYDPVPLRQITSRLGLQMPPVTATIERWVDHLLDTRFGTRAPRAGRSVQAAGTRVFVRGDRQQPSAVFLHGVMLNEHSWTPLTDRIAAPTLAVDLPGLGRSAPGGGRPGEWLNGVLSTVQTRPLLVGHSLGTAFAVDYAARHPERVSGLVLVSPFFLQGRLGWALRQRWLMGRLFRFASAGRMAKILDGTIDESRGDALDLLSRPSVSHHNARWLSWAARTDVRTELTEQLAALKMPVTLVVGSRDPLRISAPANAMVINIDGAGHHPQLTHVDAVDRAIQAANSPTATHRRSEIVGPECDRPWTARARNLNAH